MRTVFTHTDPATRSVITVAQYPEGGALRITCDRPGERAVSHAMSTQDFDAMVAAARTFPGTDET